MEMRSEDDDDDAFAASLIELANDGGPLCVHSTLYLSLSCRVWRWHRCAALACVCCGITRPARRE